MSYKINIFLTLSLFLIVSNCSIKNNVKHHGSTFLEKKQKILIPNKSNKNDIRKLLGSPSTQSKFDNDTWIYIETKSISSELKTLGKTKTLENNVLVLELDNYGILKTKKFYNVNDMKNIDMTKNTTETNYTRNSFVYDFLSSMRQKINDPLGQRAKKRRELNQR